MTEAVFQAPKRRAKVYEQFEAPLPVSPSADDGRDVIVCRAELISDNILITNAEHIQHLYSRGYFGKGVFSRSRPDHVISQRWEHVGERCLPVISSSEYEQRLLLAREALEHQGLEEEAVLSALQSLSEPLQLKPQEQALESPSEPSDRPPTGQHMVEEQLEGDPRFDRLAPPEAESPAVKLREEGKEESGGCYDYVLVEEEEEEEEEERSPDVEGRRLRCRMNPFSMLEYLQLSYEEAFFLVYALGCLTVRRQGEDLAVAELWRTLRSLQPSFCFSYAVYHRLRAKGWVPKPGLKYGADFMLYRKGPPFYHASYSVVVERVDESCTGFSLRRFSWRSLAALSRITGNVSKELMLCFVITPSELSEEQLSSPQCLRSFTLQELLLSRWVSSRERSEQEEL